MKQPLKIERHIDEQADGMVLRDYLAQTLRLSRRAVKAIKFGGGELLINGEPKTVRYRLKAGDDLCVTFPPEEKGAGIQSEPVPLAIVHEDDAILVVNKPAGMVTVPSPQQRSGALANGVLHHLEQQGLAYTVHPVNRLDRDTSGLVLFAKHRYAHDLFAQMQRQSALHRQYIAVVHGRLDDEQGVIKEPIGRKTGSIIERCVDPNGKSAITHFSVVKRLDDMTVVSVQLETGRTHQIRVHFAHIGHPLVGDDLYGGSRKHLGRQALHSGQLTFSHPFTGEKVSFHAPLPDDLSELIEFT